MLERQNRLFDEWRQGRSNFVTDGVVDEHEYTGASRKILFLMKEVNGGENWELCKELREGGRPQTWDNVARWVEGILNTDREIPWRELKNGNLERRREMLKKICVVNVKKTPGGNTSVGKEIKNAGAQDAAYLKKQIDIYDPEIIICCGTDGVYAADIAGENFSWLQTDRGIWYAYDKGRLVIAYAHPAARVQSSLLYYGLIDAVREILTGKMDKS